MARRATHLVAAQDKPCKFSCLLKPPPVNLEWPSSSLVYPWPPGMGASFGLHPGSSRGCKTAVLRGSVAEAVRPQAGSRTSGEQLAAGWFSARPTPSPTPAQVRRAPHCRVMPSAIPCAQEGSPASSVSRLDRSLLPFPKWARFAFLSSGQLEACSGHEPGDRNGAIQHFNFSLLRKALCRK